MQLIWNQQYSDSTNPSVIFTIVNSRQAKTSVSKLFPLFKGPVWQDTDEVDAWSAMKGGKDDIYIYRADGTLYGYYPMSEGLFVLNDQYGKINFIAAVNQAIVESAVDGASESVSTPSSTEETLVPSSTEEAQSAAPIDEASATPSPTTADLGSKDPPSMSAATRLHSLFPPAILLSTIAALYILQ
mmetsp:Transcript_9293/g.10747  ORF Transcript_9293/g.10747 Transcript_9293/m.10747 type:complete len:186 (+) Transcript_9293:97-654(+)